MGVYENMIQNKANKLDWTAVFVASVAGKFDIPGASEASLSKAFNRTRELPSRETALPLDLLLGRFLKMCAAFEPFKLRLDDPVEAKTLLEDFEAGNLVVSVTRQDLGALIYPVFVIESESNKLFQGIQDGETCSGVPGAPIKDQKIADDVVKMLKDMGCPCRAVSIRTRTTEAKIARSIRDLGFTETAA